MSPPDMPNDPIAEQVEVRRKGRQRLIGAVALALAAVVFVPMLLDPEPRRDRVEPVLAIPPKDNGSPLVAATKLPEPATPAESPKPALAEAPVPAGSAPGPAAPPPEKAFEPAPAAPKAPAPKSEPRTAPKAATKPVPAAPKLEGFAVQVGAFRDEAKLAHAREKIAAAHLAHYTERLDGASGELTRLRAGPFPTREAAERAAIRLKQAGLDVRVVPLP
jgi:DedD protein